MASEFKLEDATVEFLREHSDTNHKFEAKEIANWIFKKYPEECRDKQKRSKAIKVPLDSDEALIRQLRAEIASSRKRLQKRNPAIKTTEGPPKKYYYSTASDADEIDSIENETPSAASDANPRLQEMDLYPLLVQYLGSQLSINCKRIDEKRSSNTHGKGGNIWLHPDLVGMENLSEDWHDEVNACVKEYSDRKTRLWSFEVKLKVNLSNVRQVFFQTVSNSSWANLGYLVASEIDDKTLPELRMLAGLHGIGFIKLNVDDASESQIMIPAKERDEVDWNTASRIAKENEDFLSYIKLVRKFYQTGDVPDEGWEKWENPEE